MPRWILPPQTGLELMNCVPTCYVKLNLQRDFAGDAGVPQQLIGLFQCAVLSGNAVY